MFLRNPYDTRTLKLIRTSDTVKAINNYIVSDYVFTKDADLVRLNGFSGGERYLRAIPLYGKSPLEKDIPIFNHPLLSVENNWIAADLRQCTRLDKETGKVEVRNVSEFTLTVNRFILSGAWAVGKSNTLYGNSLPLLVYGDWLSMNITRVFGLGMGDQVRLFILSAIFYASLFTEKFEEEDKEKLKLKLKKEVFADDLLDEVFAKIDKLDTLDDFCRLCYEVTGNVRVKNLDYVGLTNIVSNNWFGQNANELTLVSLTHPPTWISLVYSALSDRGFRNSFITKISESRSKRGTGQEFVKEMTNLIKSYTEV